MNIYILLKSFSTNNLRKESHLTAFCARDSSPRGEGGREGKKGGRGKEEGRVKWRQRKEQRELLLSLIATVWG